MANIVREGKSYCIIKKSKEENPKNSIGKFTTPDQRKEGLTKSKTAWNVGPVI